MHQKNIITKGPKPSPGSRVLIMIHGRGGSAEDILSLTQYLDVKDFSLVAPQATGNSWYPYSFMAPVEHNEPWLSSALALLKNIVDELLSRGIEHRNIFLLGFSQGACLTLEFAARHAAGYGGVIAFTGGLIGAVLKTENYKGDLSNTAVFIGSSDPDPHVPVERVLESEKILKEMKANVEVKIYKDMGHTINSEELEKANGILNNTNN